MIGIAATQHHVPCSWIVLFATQAPKAKKHKQTGQPCGYAGFQRGVWATFFRSTQSQIGKNCTKLCFNEEYIQGYETTTHPPHPCRSRVATGLGPPK